MNYTNTLGAIYKTDKRDFSLEKAHELLGTTISRPDTMPITKIQQVWQNNFPACSGHAGVHLKEIQEYIESGVSLKFSPAYLWKRIKQIDGYPPEQGSDMKSIFKILQSNGVCDYQLLPNDYTQTLAQYSDASVITPYMDSSAQPRIIASYAFCKDLSMSNLKEQIWLNKAVILLIQCDNGFFGTDTPTFTSRPYGHFVVGIGYSPEGIFVQDSTEIAHPVKFIKNEYAPYIIQAGTSIDLPNDVVKKLVAKKSALEQLKLLWTKYIEILKR